MTEMSDWFQNNWIDLARLLVQCAILAAVVRYGRKLLATLRASQEQVGALLKLSVSNAVEEERAVAPAHVPEPELSPEPEPELTTHFERKLHPRKSYEPASVRFAEPAPEMEPEPEPVLAGFSRGSYSAEREQSLGGRLMGTQAPSVLTQTPTFSTQAPVSSTAAARTESPSLTPWVSAPAMEPERLSVHTAPASEGVGVSSWLQAPMRRRNANPWRKMVRWLQAPVRS